VNRNGWGGLISGISSAVKTVSEEVKVYGVGPTAAPGAYRSLREGVCHETLDVGESASRITQIPRHPT